MEQFTDRDIAYDMLYCAKNGATVYTQGTMEAADNRIRNLFHRFLDDCLEDQWRIWQYLHRKNEYRVEEVSQQSIDSLRQRMDHLVRTHEQRTGRGTANAGYSNAWQSQGQGSRWNSESWENSGSDIGFEPAANMPRGTQFEPDRQFAQSTSASERGRYGQGATTYQGTRTGYGNTGPTEGRSDWNNEGYRARR